MASPPSSHTPYPGNDATGTTRANPEVKTPSTTEVLERKIQHLQNSVDSLVKIVSEQLPRLQLRQRTLETKQAALEAKANATRSTPAERGQQRSDCLDTITNTELSSDRTAQSSQKPSHKIRDSANITLAITIRVNNKSSHEGIFTHHKPAAQANTLYTLRDAIVATCSEAEPELCEEIDFVRMVHDLSRVTYKLEEDGYAASMSLEPTRIDRASAFPESEYEAWFYRNVLRGNKAVYMVDVKIDIKAEEDQKAPGR